MKRVGTHEVHFPVENGVIASVSEQVRPGQTIHRHRLRVVPDFVRRNVLTGHERSARRDAERGVAVIGVESDSHFSQSIHIWRLDDRVSVRRRELSAVLIGHDYKEVGFVGQFSALLQLD